MRNVYNDFTFLPYPQSLEVEDEEGPLLIVCLLSVAIRREKKSVVEPA